jgi:bifunctional non-homologous end joining protein LigD
VRSSNAAFRDISKTKIKGEMLELAEHIIETKRGTFDPSAFHDRYEAALADLVKAKMEGKTIQPPPREKHEKVVDLLDALRQSAERSRGTGAERKSAKGSTRRSTKTRRPAQRKKSELIMALEVYRRKRDFSSTAEPKGRKTRQSGRSFVVQKHDATRLHYDFRLEMDGVLKSWAVTRGPSLNPGERRLAVHVEDHPLEYGDFEGTIPEGQYGGGTVIVWDRGVWTPIGDPQRGYAKGHLDFELEGEKLRGRWHLARMTKKAGEKKQNWLLIKGNDEYADPESSHDILVDQPESVKTGRDMEEVERGDVGPSPRKRKMTKSASKKAGSNPLKPAIARGTVKLTHPDRLYWPDEKVTKQGLADYYAKVWRSIEPFIIGRALALVRCPDGVAGDRFFQKHPWKGINPRIALIKDPKEKEPLIGVNDFDGLMGLVQSATLEIHPWGSMANDWERPDVIIMDLDPGDDVPWAKVIAAAEEMRARLEAAGLVAFVKTSGGKGLHVVSPLEARAKWPEVKAFTKAIADDMAAESPDRFIATIAKAKRHSKVLIDYLRNQRGATAIAPYSTRARPGAAVSMPLSWDELRSVAGPAEFTIENTPSRLGSLKSDPWEGFRSAAAPIEKSKATKQKGR